VPKPYPCRVLGCCKSYTDPSSLRKHSKTHEQREGVCAGGGAVASRVASGVGVLKGIPGIASIPGHPGTANLSRVQDNFVESRIGDAAEDSKLAVSRVANETRTAAGASRVEVESRVAEMTTNAQASRVEELTTGDQSALGFRPKEEHIQEIGSRRGVTPNHREPNDKRTMHFPKEPDFSDKVEEQDQSLMKREESRCVSHWLTTLTQDKPLDLTTNSI
jgi:hypothetical protein